MLKKNKVLVAYINSIIDELKIEVGRLTFEDKDTLCDEIVKETIDDIKKAYPNAKISLTGKTGETLVIDKERLAQVLKNLIINAIKYSASKKGVKVKMTKASKTVRISVRDSGKGISAKEQGQLFSPFFRTKSAKASGGPGLGLGLYISKQIIERYGGKIGVISKYRKGTEFYFELPLKGNNLLS